MQVKRIIGSPGGGKTRRMTEDAIKAFEHPAISRDWTAIGFSSLTKTARTEASNRLGEAIGVSGKDLRKDGWFRTTHSGVYRQLQLTNSDMLGDRRSSKSWFEDAFGVSVAAGYDEDGLYEASGDRDVADSLRIWHLARVQFRTIESICAECRQAGDDVPSVAVIRQNVEHYEECKRRTRKLDFDDILAKYAGRGLGLGGYLESRPPAGKVPEAIRFWILDEAQDSSPLLVMAQQRLMSSPRVLWVWLGGDPNQTINEWNGADPRLFLQWRVVDEVQLTKSYRCPAPILKFAQKCLHRDDFPNYEQPTIDPADHEGGLRQDYGLEASLEYLHPSDDVLVLCRTRKLEAKARAILADRMIPFRSLRTGEVSSGKAEIARAAIAQLASGGKINHDQMVAVFDHFPYQRHGVRLFRPQTKTDWRKYWSWSEVSIDGLEVLGGTPEFVSSIRDGTWSQGDPKARDLMVAANRWGLKHVLNSKVRVGTIHASKGTEADKVILCTSSSRRCQQAVYASKKRACEEARVAYVAATRARRELVLTRDLRSKFSMDFGGQI